ncbi:MAG: hypothetical protein ABI166_00405 [Mucilaginibacter sp.]
MNAIIINFFLAGLLLVIFIFLLVIIIDRFKRYKIKKGLLAKLNQVAAYNQVNMETVDFPGDRAIGIDLISKVLVFLKKDCKPEIIDLKDVVYCKINKAFYKRHVRSIQLQLLQENIEKVHLLPFYQQSVDSELELSSAMKKTMRWHKLIADCISGTNDTETK